MNWCSGSVTRAPLVFKLCVLIDLIFEQYKTCVQILFLVEYRTGSGSYVTCVCNFFIRTVVARYVKFGADRSYS